MSYLKKVGIYKAEKIVSETDIIEIDKKFEKSLIEEIENN